MTRQTDHTLLSHLGFSDPDKKNPKHDEICQWLAVHAQEAFNKVSTRGPYEMHDIELERIISKGLGQYKTHVGFIDVSMIFVDTSKPLPQDRVSYGYTHASFRVNCEVKIEFVLQQTIRQIKLYREYQGQERWTVVTLKDITKDEKELDVRTFGIIQLKHSDSRPHMRIFRRFNEANKANNANRNT